MPTQIRHRDKLLGYRGILKWKDEYGQTRRRQKVFRLEKPVQLTPGGKPRGKAARKKANELWQKAAAWEDEQRVRHLRHTRGPVTLKALCEGYLDWVKAEQMTDRVVKEKERTIVQVLGFCKGTTAVDEIPVPMVHRLLRAEAERVSNNASNKLRRNLSAMWNWGRLYLDLETNPVAKVAKLPHTREPRRVPTRREVERLVAQARAEYQGLSDMADYLRKRQDYIMEARSGYGQGKGGAGTWREIGFPLTSELKDELSFWREKCPVRSPFVFVCLQASGDTYALPFRAKLNFIKSLCKRAKVAPPFSYHALRHHVASHLASRGVPMLFISKILRHSNVSMTEKYLHELGEGMHEAAAHLAFGTPEVPLTQESGQEATPARPREISGSGARIRT